MRKYIITLIIILCCILDTDAQSYSYGEGFYNKKTVIDQWDDVLEDKTCKVEIVLTDTSFVVKEKNKTPYIYKIVKNDKTYKVSKLLDYYNHKYYQIECKAITPKGEYVRISTPLKRRDEDELSFIIRKENGNRIFYSK